MGATILLLSSLILAFITRSLAVPVFADPLPDPVLDSNGEELRSGTNYYVLPVIWAFGGGLTLARRGNKICPLDVVQQRSEVRNGLPVTFAPVKGDAIQVSTDLNIKFNVPAIICNSTVWKLDKVDEALGQWFVTTGGVEGNPGQETISNWFKIEKIGGYVYKFVFCPSVCEFCEVICRDVGIFTDEGGVRRLALSDNPYNVVFVKVSR